MQVKWKLLFFYSPAGIKDHVGTGRHGDWYLPLMLYLFIESMGLSFLQNKDRDRKTAIRS